MHKLLSIILLSFSLMCFGQNVNNIRLEYLENADVQKTVNLPEMDGYKILKCDFHIHTVFSDGQVWPTVRVHEAWREGLDAIAITDHIEYLPYKEWVKGDFNASYNIAKKEADRRGILLVKAGEITRNMPPGHFNALFMEDVNALNKKDYKDAIKAAIDQGAFIEWNHPGWKAQQPDTTIIMKEHADLFKKGWIHGIEVFNHLEWYPCVMDWCLKHNAAIMSNSDIHGVTGMKYDLVNSHRPMTLVLAKERTIESLKEAMFERRTIAWFGDYIAGKEKFVKEFFINSVRKAAENKDYILLKNTTDIEFTLESNKSKKEIKSNSATYIKKSDFNGNIKVTNVISGTKKVLKIKLSNLK